MLINRQFRDLRVEMLWILCQNDLGISLAAPHLSVLETMCAMKIIHISDIHIHAAPILGFDPIRNFSACLAHVAEFQADADRIVITGDLTHQGRAESYERLKSILNAFPLQGERRPRLLVGNHDNRETFAALFGEARRDDNGFVQWVEETDAGLFVYLDTMEPGTHAGH